ncbi:hypothetical protein QQX98_012091 [Neonectria punicea]|uniref:Uncharacterized protein n=1 Tax=Neonectria punicea TaxID=979145 RepID=A0ABR1GJT4_9HYPO
MLPADFKFQFNTPTLLGKPVTAYPWSWRYILRHMFGFDAIRYSVSKASIVLFIKELQRRLDEQGIPILVRAPGRGQYRESEGYQRRAATPIFAATAKEVRQNASVNEGKFLEPVGKISTPNPVANDEAQIKGLWENTTAEVNKKLTSEGLPSLAA